MMGWAFEETVQQGVSPSHKDLVTLQEYDGWGVKPIHGCQL